MILTTNCHVRQLSPSPCWVALLRYAAVALGCSPWVSHLILGLRIPTWSVFLPHIFIFWKISPFQAAPTCVHEHFLENFKMTSKQHSVDFSHHFFGAKFYILLPCLDFPPLRISLFHIQSCGSWYAGLAHWRTETLNTLKHLKKVLTSLHSTTPRLDRLDANFVGIKAELLLHMLSWPASMETELRYSWFLEVQERMIHV